MNYYEELDKQRRFVVLGILRSIVLGWAKFMVVFMVVVLVVIILSPPGVAIYESITNGGCQSGPTHNATLDVGDATVLRVVGVRGDISVEGRSGLSAVHIEGQTCASFESKRHLDSTVLKTSRIGDEILVTVEMPRLGSAGGGEIRMDLVIFLPEDFARVEVDNADGSVSVSNVRELQAVVGYGTLNATRIVGNVDVLSIQGSMALTDVGGDVTVNVIRGYGEVELSGIGGNVAIEANRSGPARISDVGGDVTVGNAGYGQLTVSSVAGDLSVGENPGGGISIRQITGSVRLPENHGAVDGPGG